MTKNLRQVKAQQQYAEAFAALGDATRLQLLTKLTQGRPRSIAELTDGTRLSRQAVSKHLSILRDAGIVDNFRSGRESLFELNPKPIENLQNYLAIVSQQWDQALDSLKRFVEDSDS